MEEKWVRKKDETKIVAAEKERNKRNKGIHEKKAEIRTGKLIENIKTSFIFVMLMDIYSSLSDYHQGFLFSPIFSKNRWISHLLLKWLQASLCISRTPINENRTQTLRLKFQTVSCYTTYLLHKKFLTPIIFNVKIKM